MADHGTLSSITAPTAEDTTLVSMCPVVYATPFRREAGLPRFDHLQVRRKMAAAGSDFARASGARALRVSDERLCVGGALLATFSLGFVEACLHVERRPIPLRFALKFAAVNVAPSAVWSSVSVRHVALASSVPESALILPNAWAPELSPAAAARRILALRTVRALRYVTGSYGLVWSVWRVWSADSSGSPADGVIPATDEERVVRVASVGSALSRASKAKHGGHVAVVATPRQRWQQSQLPIDWTGLGIHGRGNLDDGVEQLGSDRVMLVEVEVGDAGSAEHAARIVKVAKTRAGWTSAVASSHWLPVCIVL